MKELHNITSKPLDMKKLLLVANILCACLALALFTSDIMLWLSLLQVFEIYELGLYILVLWVTFVKMQSI